MGIPSFLCLINLLMNIAKGHNSLNIARRKRSSTANNICLPGCATCSSLNGCLSCKPRFFFHLELDGNRQKGMCLTSCPRGHYGTRSPHLNVCTKCKPDCASCFSEHFCTRCHLGHYLFRGKCDSSCPKGLTANTALRECTECPTGCEVCVRRSVCDRCKAEMYHLLGQCHPTCPKGFMPDDQLMQCIPQIDCELGGWRGWNRCALNCGTLLRVGQRNALAAIPAVLEGPY